MSGTKTQITLCHCHIHLNPFRDQIAQVNKSLLFHNQIQLKLINVISRQYFILKAWQRSAFFLDINSSNNTNTKNQILNQCAGKAYTAAILQYQKNHPKCNAYVGKFQPCIKKWSDFEKCKAKVSGIFIILYCLL